MGTAAVRALLTATVALLVWLFLWPAQFGGYMTYVVVAGQSMEPTYATGDLVVARSQPDYQLDDVVVFSTGDGMVVHRIVGGDGQLGFTTLGDNNDDIDQWSPTEADVDGKAIVHIPRAGSAVYVLNHVLTTPPFPYLLAAFVFLVIVLGDDKKKRPDADDATASASDQAGESSDADETSRVGARR